MANKVGVATAREKFVQVLRQAVNEKLVGVLTDYRPTLEEEAKNQINVVLREYPQETLNLWWEQVSSPPLHVRMMLDELETRVFPKKGRFHRGSGYNGNIGRSAVAIDDAENLYNQTVLANFLAEELLEVHNSRVPLLYHQGYFVDGKIEELEEQKEKAAEVGATLSPFEATLHEYFNNVAKVLNDYRLIYKTVNNMRSVKQVADYAKTLGLKIELTSSVQYLPVWTQE